MRTPAPALRRLLVLSLLTGGGLITLQLVALRSPVVLSDRSTDRAANVEVDEWSSGGTFREPTAAHLPRKALASLPDKLFEEAILASEAEVAPQPPRISSANRPEEKVARQIYDLAAFHEVAADDDSQAAFAAELAAVDSPVAVTELLRLLSKAETPLARRDLLSALATAPARQAAAAELTSAFQSTFEESTDLEERALVLEVLGETPTAENADFLRQIAARTDLDPYERLSAGEGLMRLSTQAPELFTDAEIQTLQVQLRAEAQAAEDDPDYQSLALMALGTRKEENQTFFQDMLASTQEPGVRSLLTSLQN